ncbi:hypothetical protein [Pseudoalteromonas sp. H105]|uniref:hypothetical protein n=1 Tax=Pseudoalteromonas sp. H105 TaxID=1348393 RepID=UPI00073200A2|nr:hypothetical protein [Pseudoalteromonas sp. H105]KTF16347.1 hypothetical protein ATS75_07535 [Pseudoalteromonas sp. H105]
MRFIIIAFLVLTTAACTSSPTPVADTLLMPQKPLLKTQHYQISYSTEHQSPKVKSVQLPAHKVKRNQTVSIIADNTSVTDTLYTQITDALNAIQLNVVSKGTSDYTLSIHQLELNFVEDTKYQIDTPESPLPTFEKVSLLHPSQQCATISADVSMRLTHRASGDVVWFGKSAIESASFHREPLIYSYSQEQIISNELEVASFIHQQNTEQARLLRATQKVVTPPYKTISKISSLTKVQGPCNRTEVSALTPMMQYYLSSILIDKIKVQ